MNQITHITKTFQHGYYQNILNQTDRESRRIQRLYRVFQSLSVESQAEIDGIYTLIAEKKFSAMGFVSNFELAMSLMIWLARHSPEKARTA